MISTGSNATASHPSSSNDQDNFNIVNGDYSVSDIKRKSHYYRYVKMIRTEKLSEKTKLKSFVEETFNITVQSNTLDLFLNSLNCDSIEDFKNFFKTNGNNSQAKSGIERLTYIIKNYATTQYKNV
jgi:hypothetical protein